MISGVRASSTRIESTSSTIAKLWPRWTSSSRAPGHVVAQVVEAELVVGAVGDVHGVLRAALDRRHRRQDHAGRQAEEAVHAAHQLGLVLGQVVVDRDDVHALAGERVEVAGGGRDQGLALAGLHLGDVAQVQGGAAHDLDVEVPLAQGAGRRLADRRRTPRAAGRRGTRRRRCRALNRSVSSRSSASESRSKSSARALTWSVRPVSFLMMRPSPARNSRSTIFGTQALPSSSWLPADTVRPATRCTPGPAMVRRPRPQPASRRARHAATAPGRRTPGAAGCTPR